MDIQILKANYNNNQHAQDIVYLLNDYASDEMGGGEPLSDYCQANLVNALKNTPNAFSLLLYVDGQPAGLANCMETLSTFKCKPIVNIHDMTVTAAFRGHGLSQQLLQHVENEAQQRGACKVTLEVLTGNEVAKNSYLKFGFKGYELDPKMGQAMFWEKAL